MYSLFVDISSPQAIEQDRPRATHPEVWIQLADERDMFRTGILLSCSIGPSCLPLEYQPIRNISGGKLCSQRFIAILIEARIPCTVYPVQLFDWKTKQLVANNYAFWIPHHIRADEAIDWERSEVYIEEQMGTRWLTTLVLRTDFLDKAPPLFVTHGRYLIHDPLRLQLEKAGITGIAFAPLDAAHQPLSGVKRTQLEQQLQEKPHDWTLWYALGKNYQSSHRYEKAIEAFKQALELNPYQEDLWHRLGKLFSTRRSYDEAVQALQHAIALNPKSIARREYGAVLRELSRYEESLTNAQEWTQLWSESPLPFYEIGKAHAALEHYEEAVQAIEYGIAIKGVVGPSMEEILAMEGDMLYKLARFKESLAAYNRGLKVNERYRALWSRKTKVLRVLRRNKAAEAAEQVFQKLEEQREQNLKSRPM